MIRLDKLISQLNIGSRSDAKKLIKSGKICVDGLPVKDCDLKVDEESVTVSFEGKDYKYQKYGYYILNKPAGVVTANKDNIDKTVMDIFYDKYPELNKQEYFPVGRLDKDTVGLLLITNDGALAHNLLSPRKHVYKSYYIKALYPVTEDMADMLINGVEIEEGVITDKAGLMIDDKNDKECILSIKEGKYHQVKRMFEKVSNKVLYLKRISFGPLKLDDTLPEGEIRKLTLEEEKLIDEYK